MEQAKVLIVEDFKPLVHIQTAFLKRLGIAAVQHAGTPHEALELFQKDPFDLVVSDWGCTRFTGVDLFREITARKAQCQFVLLLPFKKRAEAKQAETAGVRLLLEKPFTFDQYAQAVEQCFQVKAS